MWTTDKTVNDKCILFWNVWNHHNGYVNVKVEVICWKLWFGRDCVGSTVFFKSINPSMISNI